VDPTHGVTALMCARETASIDAAYELSQWPFVNTEARNPQGYTAIMHAGPQPRCLPARRQRRPWSGRKITESEVAASKKNFMKVAISSLFMSFLSSAS